MAGRREERGRLLTVVRLGPRRAGALAVLIYDRHRSTGSLTRRRVAHWLVVWSLSLDPRSRPQDYATISARARWG
ncbi:MAG: hypothetical protein M0Z36_06375 [Thermaerobacter sp.]|nr:hypothetical protein [Thermaerobacter sp.]